MSEARTQTLDRLRALCARDSPLDIAEAALLLSVARQPGLDPDPYRQHLAAMVAEVADLVRRRRPAMEAMRQILAVGYGYRGDRETYDDLQNADLARVIDRRKGLPVALSVIWMHVARAQGWRATGLSFPGHFLLRIDGGGGAEIVDPFDQGASRTPPQLRSLLKATAGRDAELTPDHVADVDDRDVLLRLENNSKGRLLRAADIAGALAVMERMTAIAPDRAELWYEMGAIAERAESVGAAIRAYDRFLALTDKPHADPERAALRERARRQASDHLRELRRRLN
ncbi:MAG: transglutaminase family protein [Alphaproteobacteria bacterium]|nr:transglutaminase family protein [Alphaproteobacteria bacterium]MCW5740945.1 transglutaminase family protein [Alphaproteobacteria bacterium]